MVEYGVSCSYGNGCFSDERTVSFKDGFGKTLFFFVPLSRLKVNSDTTGLVRLAFVGETVRGVALAGIRDNDGLYHDIHVRASEVSEF